MATIAARRQRLAVSLSAVPGGARVQVRSEPHRLGTALSAEGVNIQQILSIFGGETAVAVVRGASALGPSHTICARSWMSRRFRLRLLVAHKQTTSLLFFDFSQLLGLGEQTGLTRSAGFMALLPDLKQIRGIGLCSTSGETDTTAELFLQIP